MDFDLNEKQAYWRDRVRDFIEAKVRPAVPIYAEQDAEGDRWKVIQIVQDLKAEAKAAGIWNLFMPPANPNLTHIDDSFEFEGPGLTNLEYALCAEEMGRIGFASAVFNCSAPDTGNMEVFHRYGTLEQKEKWLRPLMDGEIRSAFLMTEPAVASSDATNIETRMVRDGDEYVLNGRKWWTTNAVGERCKIMLVMGLSNPDAERHRRHSTILVPRDTPGIKLVRPLRVFDSFHSPGGEAEFEFVDVRVPVTNMIKGEGCGFEIAQGRLGPGRFQYAMTLVGAAQRCLELMCARAEERVAFGEKLSKKTSVQHEIARSRCEIEQCRLLVLQAAEVMDREGVKAALPYISMVKIVGPQMAQNVADRAMQVFGGMGVCQDTMIPDVFTHARFCRIADGPDEVHMSQLAKLTIRELAD